MLRSRSRRGCALIAVGLVLGTGVVGMLSKLPLLPSLGNDLSVWSAARELRAQVRADGAEIVAERRAVGNLGYNDGCEGEVLLAVRSDAPEALRGEHDVFCVDGETLSWWWPGAGCLRMERLGTSWAVPEAPVDLGLGASDHDDLRAFADEAAATHVIRQRFRLPGWRDLDLRCH